LSLNYAISLHIITDFLWNMYQFHFHTDFHAGIDRIFCNYP